MIDKLVTLLAIGTILGMFTYMLTYKNLFRSLLTGILGAFTGGFLSEFMQLNSGYKTPSLLVVWIFSSVFILLRQLIIIGDYTLRFRINSFQKWNIRSLLRFPGRFMLWNK